MKPTEICNLFKRAILKCMETESSTSGYLYFLLRFFWKLKSPQQALEMPADTHVNKKYRIIKTKCLGEGRFSKVYMGERISDDTEVVVKCVPKETLPSNFLDKTPDDEVILREVIVMRLCSSIPGCVALLDFFETEDEWVIVMEWIEGARNLVDYIQENGPVSEPTAVLITRQLVNILLSLYSVNVLHRDVKLDNILFNEDTKKIYLIDFNFSVIMNTRDEVYTDIVGTPGYMCPKMITKCAYHGLAAEVWALGCTVYAMLYGDMPFNSLRNTLHNAPAYDESLTLNHRDFLHMCLKKHEHDRKSLEELASHPWLKSRCRHNSLGWSGNFRPRVLAGINAR